MGVNVIDVDARFTVCSDDPTEVTIKLVAERDSPAFDESVIITQGEHRQLLDAATSFSTFESKAEQVIEDFWDELPETSPDEFAKSALYNAYKVQRSTAVTALC